VKRRLSRRAFLAAGGAAAGLAAPALVSAQGPRVLRLQSVWDERDLFHELALDFARGLSDMSGGDLRVEVLPGGASAPPFGILERVSSGELDASHGMPENHYARHAAFALWGSGPAYGMPANLLLAWHHFGGGRALLEKLYATVGANVVSFLYGPMPAQPLGWFRRPVGKPQDLNGLRFRTAGMSIDVFVGLGAVVNALPAADVALAVERGLLDGAELGNPSSDRALGLSRVLKVYMQKSYHRSAAQLEVLFNKAWYEALPDKLRVLVGAACDAASARMTWKAIDRFSQDYLDLVARDGVRTYRTPDAVLQRQLEAHDAAVSKRRHSALFREIADSQRRFAERAVRWLVETQVGAELAYRHYFGRAKGARPAKK
jgi:TRAP-type mannitol/chloroaromatic compound transport system substrate-binding protein